MTAPPVRIGTVFEIRPGERGEDGPYRQVSCVGVHALSESENEIVLASTTDHVPTFSIDPAMLYAAGYAVSEAESEALQERRAAAAAAIEATRLDGIPALPWEA